ncbi:CBS domain-containing membrane protein [Aspergillus bombycis]|uniref:CBS domain-containing membrane protein n=1 Tax=Aspergillus bombycis TaxID=109264 RepID=A0A1F8AH25_9EURO|nr:CBS domain-containing membrane protein [Aspergillus bombycis]OGM51050.1 CBS domain-containing membrane protein [Aspergillus bombycis]
MENKKTHRQRSRQRPAKYWHSLTQLKFCRDYRSDLPPSLSRFTGYRPPDEGPPYDPLPIPPFIWLPKVPLKYETWLFAWIGAFGGILLIEAIMSTETAFRDVYHTPTIITSFGASAVLLFGVVESPVAQPRNFIGGHFLSALVGTCITRLFVLNGQYQGYLDNTHFHPATFINGGISMATSLLVMLMTGTVHLLAGATGLNAAVQSDVVSLSWRYLPTVLASSLIMLAWAILVNNLGRRRYPLHWWAPGPTFVLPPGQNHDQELRRVEEGEIDRGASEGDLAVETGNPSEAHR